MSKKNHVEQVISRAPKGIKHDTGKLRMDLVDPGALWGMVEVLTYGASKYEARNWEKGIEFGRVFAAVQRHLWAWWGGEENDQESGLSHLDHAAVGIHFLSAFMKRGDNDLDDRP